MGALLSGQGGGSGGGLFDTVLTPAAISFGPDYDVWDPGDLGRVTLILCTTDGSSRDVRGLKTANDGDIVVLMNVNPDPTDAPVWKHAAAASGGFRNAATTDVTGGAGGSVWYRYSAADEWWQQIAST